MGVIHVCPLSKVESIVGETGARSLVTLVGTGVAAPRPAAIPADRHLTLAMSDISIPREGYVLPQADHVQALLDFGRRWDRREPLLIHCLAGVSRSTAAAFVLACGLIPERSESELAALIRRVSPTATPNPRIVALGDGLLAREGRMIAAIAAIGRGSDCFEGVPFRLEID